MRHCTKTIIISDYKKMQKHKWDETRLYPYQFYVHFKNGVNFDSKADYTTYRKTINAYLDFINHSFRKFDTHPVLHRCCINTMLNPKKMFLLDERDNGIETKSVTERSKEDVLLREWFNKDKDYKFYAILDVQGQIWIGIEKSKKDLTKKLKQFQFDISKGNAEQLIKETYVKTNHYDHNASKIIFKYHPVRIMMNKDGGVNYYGVKDKPILSAEEFKLLNANN